MGLKGLDWFDVAYERDWWGAVVNAVVNYLVLSYMVSLVTSRRTVSFSESAVFHLFF
jgi:hypothetical protein